MPKRRSREMAAKRTHRLLDLVAGMEQEELMKKDVLPCTLSRGAG